MAEINFVPCCSNCGVKIYDEVGVEYVDELPPNDYLYRRNERVYPHKCPFCGEFFDCITIPSKLPYQNFSLLSVDALHLFDSMINSDEWNKMPHENNRNT